MESFPKLYKEPYAIYGLPKYLTRNLFKPGFLYYADIGFRAWADNSLWAVLRNQWPKYQDILYDVPLGPLHGILLLCKFKCSLNNY